MSKNLPHIVFWALIACLLLSACDEAPSPVPPPKAAAKTAVSAPAAVAQIVEDPVAPAYVYISAGTRDPFMNPLSVVVEVSDDAGTPLTPLQKFDLGQLRLIGIIIGKGNPRAMVIAPDKKSFILQKGVKVGKNNGVVIEIKSSAVLVLEKFVDFSGEVQTRVEEITLPQQGGAQ